MLHIGCHLSSSGGYLHMGQQAQTLGADTFQFFTRNPRGSRAKPFDADDAAALCDFLRANQFAPIIAHAPYTLNPCSAKPEVREFARQTMADDLDRLAHLPDACYNFHPGSHTGQGVEAGIAQIIDALDAVCTPAHPTTILLETMAGKGTEVGGRFEELRAILDGVRDSSNLGVCLDTCHVHDAGYDLVHDLDGVLTEFDRVIGLERLKAVHLNDSKNPLGSHKDRHEKIGEGDLGLEACLRIVSHPALRDLPFVLETPNDLSGYAREIALLRQGVEAG
jgi:deoxyribonuclease-4